MAFTFSLGLHILLAFLLSHLPEKKDILKENKPLEIVFQENRRTPLLIQAPENQKSLNKKPKKEVRFKSNKTQRTNLETWKKPLKSSPMKSFMSSSGQRGNNQKDFHKNQNNPSRSFIPKKKQWSDNFRNQVSMNKNRKPLKLPGFGHSGNPSIPNFVQQKLPPGVRLGNVTALNTDQHRFYSFNQRLLARFLPLWGSQVSRTIYQWIKKNNAPVISKSWITQVEVIMDRKGEILEVLPFRLSGFWSIDNATIDSFKKVNNVPNPPEEMIDENGYIHLQFQTEVLWIPQPNLRLQGRQSN